MTAGLRKKPGRRPRQRHGVRAVLKYGTEERGYDYELTIEKPELEGGALLRQSIQADVLRHQAENPSDETFLLPASVGEETLTWYVPKKSDGLKVFVFGNLLVVLFYLSYEDRKFQKNRQRERELAADYRILCIG